MGVAQKSVLSWLALFAGYCYTLASAAQPPHIVFILTDDLGWNFPGYHNPHVITPTLDHLATKEGVRLESAYMYKYCSPSRGSFLTGRYPWRLPSVRCNFIPSSIPEGVPLEYNFLPKHLSQANYESYHIGKWHLGFHTAEYTPVARGFNHSWGFLEGGEDHWTHQCGAGKVPCKVPGQPPKSTKNWDLWSQSTTDFPGSPLYGYNGTKGDESTYSGYIFSGKAVDFIHSHNVSRSMFMYLALHNTHAPIEAPDRFISMYNFNDTQAPRKNTFFAMVSVVDETVKNVTEALKKKGMWDNTLLVWTTDNGSPVHVAGSNHPLRGGKGSNWEGGTRVPTFVSGGALPKSMHGQSLDGLVHVSDWYATFSAVAGLRPEADPAGPAPPDSVNVWPYLIGQVTKSPRNVLVHDHHMFTNASKAYGCGGQSWFELPGYNSLGAIRVGQHKLLVGPERQASWFGQFSPNSTAAPDVGATACWGAPCLFDMIADPGEHVDIALANPELAKALWKRFNDSNHEPHPATLSPRQDGDGFCKAVRSHAGWVAPWLGLELSSSPIVI